MNLEDAFEITAPLSESEQVTFESDFSKAEKLFLELAEKATFADLPSADQLPNTFCEQLDEAIKEKDHAEIGRLCIAAIYDRLWWYACNKHDVLEMINSRPRVE